MLAVQTAVLACTAVVVFWGFYTLDFFARPGASRGGDPISRYFAFDPGSLSDTFASLGGVNAAVFGIVITVVSIIVQLTAERYTGVARMFLRDRINLLVPAYYVVTCVVSVWLSATLRDDYVPAASLAVALSMTTGGLVIMAPYFSFVFWFLEPRNIIFRIRRDAVKRATLGASTPDKKQRDHSQAQTLFALEELTDITNNSISGRDKIIASGAVDALKDLTLDYLKVKPQAHEAWFAIGSEIRLNPDFVAMDPESLADLETRRTWLEWKVMRQFLSIYNDALGTMRDINYLIAIDTRYIGEAALDRKDDEVVNLVFRFMNSYMRATLNAKAVRTAYNVLNQYRLLVEDMLKDGRDDIASGAVGHMIYYGRTSYDMQLGFVTETVAYDVGALCELAHHHGGRDEALLTQFLELDQPLRAKKQEHGLIGIRKAQVKLACYYLMAGAEDRARRIADDMREEPLDRRKAIREQLERVESKDFWEIIDRGRNFEYMPPPQRSQMATFFTWFGQE